MEIERNRLIIKTEPMDDDSKILWSVKNDGSELMFKQDITDWRKLKKTLKSLARYPSFIGLWTSKISDGITMVVEQHTITFVDASTSIRTSDITPYDLYYYMEHSEEH